ncbi:MAG: AtpZ/AtpI family protein [Thermodesulfobacteriota bacterium]
MYFIVVGTNFGFSVAAGLLLGRYLDNKFGNEVPYFTVLGLLAGVISGMTLLIKMLKMKNDNKQ